jgi:hypothetical protein
LEIKLMSVPGVELVGEQHQGRAAGRSLASRHADRIHLPRGEE